MNNKDFFEIILNHFLITTKNISGGYTISDYKFNIYKTGFEVRDASEKVFLDNINSLKNPIIKDLIKNEECVILPPTRNWKSLTLKINGELYSLNNGLKLLFSQNKMPAIFFEDLKIAFNRPDKMELRVRICVFNQNNNNQIKQLFDFAKNKSSIVTCLDFYQKVLSNFIIVKSENHKFNFGVYTLDENLNLKFNYNSKFDSINFQNLNFEIEDFGVIVSPPTKNWKNTLTLKSGNSVNSIIQGFPSLFQKYVPVIFYDDLVNSIECEKFEIPVKLLLGEKLGFDNFNNLKSFVIEQAGLSKKTFGIVLNSEDKSKFKPGIDKDFVNVKKKGHKWLPKIFWR